jgi:2-oxoglutarate ferredoxin oxidoreductase subunit gamma
MSGTGQIEVLLTGVGGQGIQLIAKTLALAATESGKQVQMSANYGAEIRGGHSDASVCIATSGLDALPILPSASHAVVMHGMSWDGICARLRPGSLAVVNENAVELAELSGGRVVSIPVDDIAAGLGAPGAASFVMLSAFAGLTGVVTAGKLQAAMRVLVPPYRSNLIAANQIAIEAGFAVGRARAGEVAA